MPGAHPPPSDPRAGPPAARGQIDALQRLSLDLAAAQSTDQVAAVVVDHAAANTGAVGAALWLVTTNGTAAAAATTGILNGAALPAPDVAALHTGDPRRARPWLTNDLAAALRSHGAARTRAATLYAGAQAVGVLALCFDAEGPGTTGGDAASLAAIVRPAAEAIARARGVAEALQLAAIVESTDDAIIAATPEQEIFAWNPGAERLFGCSAADAVGSTLSSVLGTGVDGPDVGKMIARLRAGGGPERVEVTRRAGDGTARILDQTISPMRDKLGTFVGVTIAARDITRSVQLAEELKRAQRLEALGRLAGGVAHDFNNLLTVIIGCLDLLRMQPGAADRHELVAEALDASTSAKDLTAQLLAFASAQPIEPVAMRLQEEAHAMSPLLMRLLGPRIALTVDAEAEAPSVIADPSQIRQIIMNLVLNARDALPEGGEVAVSIASEASRDAVLLTVADTGHGMEPAVVERLFEPFFTTKEEGTGLGLAIVHGAVTQAGGTIEVQSTPGAGTRFMARFPIAPARGGAAQIRTVAGPAQPGARPATVLLCDDDAAVLSITSRILDGAGYDVIATSHVSEAHAHAVSDRSIDLLVTDVRMPQMTGPDLVAKIATDRPDLPVLFVSGYAGSSLTPEGHAGPRAVLGKPYEPASLLAAIRELIELGHRRDGA